MRDKIASKKIVSYFIVVFLILSLFLLIFTVFVRKSLTTSLAQAISGVVIDANTEIRVRFNTDSERLTYLCTQAGTPTTQPTTVPITGYPSEDICNPANGPFSTTITNPYLPFEVGNVNVLSDGYEGVRVTVLDDSHNEIVAGVETRVIEEYEYLVDTGDLIEISNNYFVQAPDGTVCYYGEHVDVYLNGSIVSNDGSWRAWEGQNKAGIMMPANPAVGMQFYVELAPDITIETGTVESVGQSYQTVVETFPDTVHIREAYTGETSHKHYARGVGMVGDNDMTLISYPGNPNPTPTGVVVSPTSGVSSTPTGGEEPPPAGLFPDSEQVLAEGDVPQLVQDVKDQTYPTSQVLEIKLEIYNDYADVYAYELVVGSSIKDLGILADGRIVRNE